MSEAKRDAWTGRRLSEAEILYRGYTTQYYGFGGPHPLTAPAEIRSRMARAQKVHRRKMELALAYAMKERRAWIADLRREERYLRAAGWRSEPFEREEYLGDDDTWISPHTGQEMSRMGAMAEQCTMDGHAKPRKVVGPMGILLTCCPRCGAAFAPGT